MVLFIITITSNNYQNILHFQLQLWSLTNLCPMFPSYMMFCAIWYHLYNFKNVKNTYKGVLLLVKLQAKNILHKFSELYKFYISFLGV